MMQTSLNPVTRVALDDRYSNKFASLDSTSIYPKPGHQPLYTPMTGEMKCPRLYLCLAHSIPTPPLLMQHMYQPITKWYDPLHIIMWPYWFIDLDFTCFSPLLQSIGAKSSLNLPFTLATSPLSQVMSWSSPPWSHDSMSCLMCNELLHHHMCLIWALQHLRAISTSMAYVAHTHVHVYLT